MDKEDEKWISRLNALIVLGVSDTSCDQLVYGQTTYEPVPPEELWFQESITPEHEGVPFSVQPKIRAYDKNVCLCTVKLTFRFFILNIDEEILITGIRNILPTTNVHLFYELMHVTQRPCISPWTALLFHNIGVQLSHNAVSYQQKINVINSFLITHKSLVYL